MQPRFKPRSHPDAAPLPYRARLMRSANLLLSAMLLAPAVPALSSTRLGGGPSCVRNPEHPARGRTERVLTPVWRLGDDPDDEIFGEILAACRDAAGNICMLDGTLGEVRVYGPDARPHAGREPGGMARPALIRTLGRIGDGPGEYRRPVAMCLLADGRLAVAQMIPARLVLFDREGRPAGAIEPDASSGSPGRGLMLARTALAVGEGVGLTVMMRESGTRRARAVSILALFDLDGRPRARLLVKERAEEPGDRSRLQEADAWDGLERRWTAAADGTIYAAPEYHGYRIHRFDVTLAETVIARDHRPLARDAHERKRREAFFAALAGPQAGVAIEDLHRDIEQVAIGPDGNVWVLASSGAWRNPPGVLATFDIFDSAGRFIEQTALLGEGDPADDDLWLLGDRLLLVRGQRASREHVREEAGERMRDGVAEHGHAGASGRAGGGSDSLACVCYAL